MVSFILMNVFALIGHPMDGSVEPRAHLTAESGSVSVIDSIGRLRPPYYLKRVGKHDGITIWIVDGAYVRTNIDMEFTNFGHHLSVPSIPADEFWLDREASRDEQGFFIHHLVTEHDLMKRGMSYDSALAIADQQEITERARSGDPGKMMTPGFLPDPARAHVRLWKKLETGVTVWIVNGRLVRSVFDVDFTEGGHEHVYEFVPHDEVWIDNDLMEAERPYVLLHELHERNLMAQGWTYDKAHEDASAVESYCRHHPNELHIMLGKEGWE